MFLRNFAIEKPLIGSLEPGLHDADRRDRPVKQALRRVRHAVADDDRLHVCVYRHKTRDVGRAPEAESNGREVAPRRQQWAEEQPGANWTTDGDADVVAPSCMTDETKGPGPIRERHSWPVRHDGAEPVGPSAAR